MLQMDELVICDDEMHCGEFEEEGVSSTTRTVCPRCPGTCFSSRRKLARHLRTHKKRDCKGEGKQLSTLFSVRRREKETGEKERMKEERVETGEKERIKEERVEEIEGEGVSVKEEVATQTSRYPILFLPHQYPKDPDMIQEWIIRVNEIQQRLYKAQSDLMILSRNRTSNSQ